MYPAVHLSSEGLRTAVLSSAADFDRRNGEVDLLVIPDQEKSPYLVGFAMSGHCIEQALRLRYGVFNQELGEGLMSSNHTGLDRDEFDNQMDHLVLVEKATSTVIGTYRLQTVRKALQGLGTYSAREYDLKPLEPYFPEMLETGRACIDRQHRNFFTIMHLWKGLGAYMIAFQCRYLFGCCSLTSLDPDDGWRAMKTLRQRGALHPELLMDPTPAFSCGDPSRENDPDIKPGYKIPKLFSTYLTLGTKVVSLPAVDREFGTVDFLVMLDSKVVNFSSLVKAVG